METKQSKHEKNLELIGKYRQLEKDKNGIIEEFIRENNGLIQSAVNKYAGICHYPGAIDRKDLVQVVMIRMSNTFKNWNPDEGPLSTFIGKHVFGALVVEVRNHRTVEPRRTEKNTAQKIKGRLKEIKSEIPELSDTEAEELVAAEFSLTVETVGDMLRGVKMVSLEPPSSQHGDNKNLLTPMDILFSASASAEEEVMEKLQTEKNFVQLITQFKGLTSEERACLLVHFGYNADDIGFLCGFFQDKKEIEKLVRIAALSKLKLEDTSDDE